MAGDKLQNDQMFRNAYHAALVVQLVSLRARLKVAESYPYNQHMGNEREMLYKQVDALEAETRKLFEEE